MKKSGKQVKEWKNIVAATLLGLLLSLPLSGYASVQKDGVHITLLHTNDIHARVLPTDDNGKTIGMAWIAGAIRREKETEPDTLALDAGDTFKAGNRVSDVLVQEKPLDRNVTYTLALSDFTAAGGDGYEMLKGAKKLGQYGTSGDVLSRYLLTHKVTGIEPGRVKVKLKNTTVKPS